MSLEEFARRKYDNDILVRVILKKIPQDSVYLSMRNTQTDFPVLTCAVTRREEKACAVIGARPARAVAIYDEADLLKNVSPTHLQELLLISVAEHVVTGSNKRAQGTVPDASCEGA